MAIMDRKEWTLILFICIISDQSQAQALWLKNGGSMFLQASGVDEGAVAGSTEYLNGEGHYNYGIVFREFQLKDYCISSLWLEP